MRKEEKGREKDLEEKIDRNTKHIWWLTILIAVLFGAFYGFGYAAGAGRILKDVGEANPTIKMEAKDLEVTEIIKNRLSRFVTVGSIHSVVGNGALDSFINGTTSLDNKTKLYMTKDAVYFDNALTKDVVLTESIDSNITGNPIAAGMIVDIIEKDTFDNIYRSLFSEEPSYEFSELAHIGCPAPTTMDNTTHKMYLVHACGGASTTIYRNNITSITSDKEFYYVREDIIEESLNHDVKTTKLVWKFDKDLKFVSTTVE